MRSIGLQRNRGGTEQTKIKTRKREERRGAGERKKGLLGTGKMKRSKKKDL